MLSLQPIPLADLLLSRLLFADKNGMTVSELKAALKAIAGSELSNTAYTEQIETTLASLSEQGYTQPVSSSRYQLSDAGRQHILDALYLKTLPPDSSDIPVEVVGFEIEGAGVGQQLREPLGDLVALVFGHTNVDGHRLHCGVLLKH